ncbi:hypothetical protein [Plantactinospora endophytica]|uniref:Integrase n=1 Tax=Plantactinospora endophytica TaxID=673535 RepID=A0ABQ4EDQ4_9ACTN|nr:hypothetical protein [Plantactinospora endophytica]GIG92853.1 hypothetical protein Pen02_77890 [Plantactinospora endophytica]
MRVAMASVPRETGRANEDFVGVLPTAAVLLDGAGMSGTESVCAHGVAWYASRLGGELLGLLALDPDQELPALLGEAIGRVADAHRGTCDIADPSSPSATVAILRLRAGRADHLVLGDSVLVLDRVGAAPLVIADRREVVAAQRYRSVLDGVAGDRDAYQRALMHYRRTYRNQPGGFWVAKDDPRAAAEALAGSLPVADLAGAALFSNGASRIVDRFGLADWPEVLAVLAGGGPAEIIRRVRQAERGGAPGEGRPRPVAPDDATIAYCTHLAEGRDAG